MRAIISKIMLSDIVCKGRCAYYKPEKSGDLACGGYLLLERWSAGGGLPPHACVRRVPPGLSLPLSLILCPACPYYRSDCDFAEGVADAPPCGGFVTVASLLAHRALDVDDLCNLLYTGCI